MDIVDVGSKVLNTFTTEQAVLEIENYKKSSHFKNKEKEPTTMDKASNALKGILGGKKEESSSSTKTASKITRKIKDAAMSNGIMMVQYNPKSLKYQASTSQNESGKEENGKQIMSITNTCTTKVSFELVFQSEFEGDTSVRDQMDFIMDTLYETPNTNIKFFWAKLEIVGQVISFSGQYDMFDKTGNPISGKMSLTIQSKMKTREIQKVIEKIDDTTVPK